MQQASLEKRLLSGFIVDVALYTEGKIAAAVEIKITHAVDEKKAGDLEVPFIELLGSDVIASPNHWRPIRSTFKLPTCQICEGAIEDHSVVRRRE
ncbi:MAG: hypothetical protein WDZ52_09970 [Pseudohongiellaceae bacterium]